MTGKPIEAFGRDAWRLDGEATKAAVCEADAPNTSPMDKTVEVSQAARELLPCPFCGGEPSVSTYETESLWSHNIVTYTQVGCGECDYSFASEPGYETEAPHRWNTRATQPEAALREALACVDGDAEWLCNQLEQWPTRVHPERTTNISYLMKSAAKLIRAALNDHRHG